MNLFIQIKDGMPINYPAFEDNLIEAFGRVPDDWSLLFESRALKLAFMRY